MDFEVNDGCVEFARKMDRWEDADYSRLPSYFSPRVGVWIVQVENKGIPAFVKENGSRLLRRSILAMPGFLQEADLNKYVVEEQRGLLGEEVAKHGGEGRKYCFCE